ncbi:hypothetical protein Q7P37_004635 [Cladosporium fusiforme]
MADTGLTPAQSAALFDVLTHHETYREIEDFKQPGAIHRYGPPFQDDQGKSDSPVLQTLLSKFILPLPGLRDVSADFWKLRVTDIINELSLAELSESFDKGILGIRKTLATAISALIEYPARGCLGGLPEKEKEEKKKSEAKKYDVKNPDDVLQAWQDCLQALVYGNLIDELFAKAAETDDLSKHDTLVQGMHEFVVVNIASIMHYTLVLSPEGPTILRMIANVHGMLPYSVVRQTLKVGNVATMISGVMRIILAKVSVSAVTNWIGLSSGADEGMNLLQQIISQVLGWEKREIKNRIAKIEKDKDAPPKAVMNEINTWVKERSREEHEECRRQSKEQGRSIVTVILSLSSPSVELPEKQHGTALEYLALTLAVRDRQEIVRVLCRSNPDHLTAAIRDGVDAYTPMIRDVHQAVNLSDTLWDFERFVTDMLKISKPQGNKKGEETPPSVEDFVDLLHRHQTSSHKFLHQVAKNSKPLMETWREYVHAAASQFNAHEKPPASASVIPDSVASGGAREKMQQAYSNLSKDDQQAVKAELESYDAYLTALHKASAARVSAVIKRTNSTPYGPGAYLARWQRLMDSTPVTPDKPQGPVRYGGSRSVKEAGRKDIDGQEAGFVNEDDAERVVDEKTPEMPSVDRTVALLGESFREVLAGN